ncbi:DNA cytosine methyltransferase [Bacillus sp. FSL K6-0046]|uniref:DNA cytosine methyltransferase n=1 Tax=unclassified Bacillus (in: firmicutes) TaxID=185979 RepID=UPI001DB40FD8|nr:DNA cytosine methyltransferase [Bacillus aerophilus]MBX7015690.1 DNA cytosine methyltransferase [Bacillus aerophilus]
MYYISLFSGGGIGDIGFRKAGLKPIVLNELENYRAQIAKRNFPEANVIKGDIKDKLKEIEIFTKNFLETKNSEELFLISATPPCQGMSKNGIGTILKAMREGKRPKVDERNLLFTYSIELVEKLKPRYFFFENVDRMLNTYYIDNDKKQKILMVDYFEQKMSSIGYKGEFRIVNFADYGLPQNRRRLVGLFSRKDLHLDKSLLFPKQTHSSNPSLFEKQHITLREAIDFLPKLDSKSAESAHSDYHPLHQVPVSRPDLYYWISNTKEGDTAFNNNKCPICSFIASKEDLYCPKCSHLLPKPVVEKDGMLRMIKGYISAYKRMKFDEPAPTITTRSAYAGSDNNVHPEQNRVLSIYEVALLQGIYPEEFKWGPIVKTLRGKEVIEEIGNITLLRDILGEPVSPVFSKKVADHLLEINKKV